MKQRRRWRAERGALIAVALVCAAGSCSVSDGELGRLHGAGGGTGGGTGGASGCGLSSPLVHVQGRPTCTGRLAASHFSNALCSCANIQLASSLATRGFDSRQGSSEDPQTTGGGASVGVNGSYLSFAAADVGGAFSIAGPADVTFRGPLTVRGDFWAAGNVTTIGVGVVARNAWLGGTLVGLGPFSVTGALHHGGAVSALPLTVGSDQAGAVTVPKPCPCEPADLVDIGAVVGAARGDNDNGALGIAADTFTALAGARDWRLPCGRAYLTAIGGTGDLLVHVSGKSAVFIDGSVSLKGSLLFDVAPGAEVDVFVKNDVATQGFALATKDRPSAGRLWVGGSQTIVLVSPWVGNLYAPHALVTAIIGLEVWGSLFVGDFSGELAANVRFDRSIIDSGAVCAAPPPTAGECKQCGVCFGGSACVSGSCGACTADSDCCGLSICANGSCVPWLEVP